MVVDPAFDLAADGRAFALAVVATTSATADSTIEEVLLQTIADAWPELGRSAGNGTSAAVASVGVVAGCVRAHERLALLVAARTLPRRTLHVVAAAVAIRSRHVDRAGSSGTRADLLRIAESGRRAADGTIGGELTAAAAVLIAVIAHAAGAEFAGRRIAAIVVATPFCAATVALLARLHNTIAALLAADGGHLFIVGQAGAFDTVATQSTADVADATWAEARDTL